MPLLDFFKNLQPQSCGCCDACDSGSCCTPENDADEPCCEGDDCCTPEEAESANCCCGDDCCPPEEKTERFIKVLGGGCKNCHKLMENTQEALRTLGMDDTVELVSEMAVIAGYGVMSTPALVVDGKVVSMGRVLNPIQAAEAIQDVRGK